jgi:hypothetical protein
MYNEGPLLVRGIRSILDQTHQDFQFIVVDDGADDETREIFDQFKDERILLIRQANDGLSAARNKALDHISGDYVCFMDADDCRPRWAFASIVRKLQKEAPDLLFCRGTVKEENDRLLPFYDDHCFVQLLEMLGDAPIDTADPKSSPMLCLTHMIEPQVANKVVKAELIRKYHLRFPNGHFFEDILFHTMAVTAARRISILDGLCFTYFRRHKRKQITSSRGERRFDILAVTKMTLELFRNTDAFQDPYRRVVVLAGCLKLVRWCGSFVALSQKLEFREMAKAVLRTADPLYLHLPENPHVELPEIANARAYLAELDLINLRETRAESA